MEPEKDAIGPPSPILPVAMEEGSRHTATTLSSFTSRDSSGSGSQKRSVKWSLVKDKFGIGARALSRHTKQFVGLEPTSSQREHWSAVQRSIVVNKLQRQVTESSSSQCINESLVQAILPHESVSPGSTKNLLGQLSVQPNSLMHSVSAPVGQSIQPSVLKSLKNKQTGRAGVGPSEQPKPDLWKIAMISARLIASKSQSKVTEPSLSRQKSFIKTTEQNNKFVSQVDNVGKEGYDGSQYTYEDDDDDIFFGIEKTPYARHYMGPPHSQVDFVPSPKPVTSPSTSPKELSPSLIQVSLEKDCYQPAVEKVKSITRRQKVSMADPNSKKQYRPAPNLGGITFKLLNFEFQQVPQTTREKLNEIERVTFHRPFFTYWLITVHFLILLISLILYGFAPYGFDMFTKRALVQKSSLVVEVAEHNVTPNVWGGPSQEALVLLGAKYGPCMRFDRQLYEGLEFSRRREAAESGCCVRRDRSGCVQVSSSTNCADQFADFVFMDSGITNTTLYTNRAVCGTSPRTCVNPHPSIDVRWQSENITGWPVCQLSQSPQVRENSTHLTCNLTGRPCCVGIQAHCLITTLEDCQFRQGRFHQEAFLCSQVDCLNSTCGLLPFITKDHPDQFYRLFTALFLHAGIIHLFFTTLFHVFVLRHVEHYLGWLRTSIIYIGSGIGGNLVSAVFVPYNPEVGPAGGILGIISFLLIYILYQAHRLQRPWVEVLKLTLVILFLLIAGLFPFIDNFAHFGGFIFGLLLSGIFVQYVPPYEVEKEFNKSQFLQRYGDTQPYKEPRDWILYTKYGFLVVGTPLVVLLYILFFVMFYVVQEAWDGFKYLNCIPLTESFCLDFGQSIRSRDIFL